MSGREIPALPWSDPTRLWFAAALMCSVVAASAAYGVVGSLVRGWPETFTTDRERP